MLQKERIIVLHTIKHSDTGIVVQCYGEKNGMEAFYFRVSSKNKIAFSHLHRLNIIDVVAYDNNSSMPTIKEIVPSSNLVRIRTDIFKSTIAIFMSELLLRSVREREGNPLLYSFLESSVNMLENMPGRSSNFHIYFMVHLCKLMGFMPTDNFTCNGMLFNPATASFETPALASTGLFSEKESLMLHNLMNTPAIELESIESNGALRMSFAKKMIEYISLHLGTSFEIKSLDILHEVFN